MLKRITRMRRHECAAVLGSSVLLGGCEGMVTVDLASAAPADHEVEQVVVALLGLELPVRGPGGDSG